MSKFITLHNRHKNRYQLVHRGGNLDGQIMDWNYGPWTATMDVLMPRGTDVDWEQVEHPLVWFYSEQDAKLAAYAISRYLRFRDDVIGYMRANGISRHAA